VSTPPPREQFRDSLATADPRGRRLWIYPTKPSGRFHDWRVVVAVLLLAFLFVAPFLRLHGNPLVLLDIVHRQFFIFGLIFWPQDIYLFVLAAIAVVVFIILFTAAFGRLFCGWTCPQTIFMEMVFRKIEYWIEGDGPRQRELARAPMSAGKLYKRVSKHAIFFAIAFVIGNTFLAYFIGSDALFHIMASPPTDHMVGFSLMLIFSLVFYWVFAWFREQVCTLVCPYGRLQSVLLDPNSIVVGYDFKRGEPRGPGSRKGAKSDLGDCIDCGACVRVCPTGIDIRNGTQLECINCTACIDACDHIMDKVGLPRGLVRYTSYEGITSGIGLRVTPRMKLYSAVFTILVGALVTLLLLRTPVEATVLRAAGSLFEELSDGSVRNLYTITVTNKTSENLPVTLRLLAPAQGQLTLLGPELVAPPQGQDESVFSIQIPKTAIYSANSLLTIGVFSGAREVAKVHTSFAAPLPKAGR
jgi:cytochrome c oxidase accessory protein FixG